MNNTAVYYASVEPLKDEALYKAMLERLPGYRLEKLNRFVFERDRRLSMGAWLLLARAAEKLGYEPDALIPAAGEQGKPYFANVPELKFNLSHSGERVMCIAAGEDCGCDVEEIKDYKPEISERFFSKEENKYLRALPDDTARKDAFYRLWTLKESYIKANGAGLRMPLDSFTVNPYELRLQTDGGEWKFFEYNIEKEYKYSCCIRGRTCPYAPEIEYITFQT